MSGRADRPQGWDWKTVLASSEAGIWLRPHQEVRAAVPILEAMGARLVLDLGCGAGRHTVYLAREGFRVHAFDVDTGGLVHCRAWLEREGLRALVCQGLAGALPYAAGAFDAVISINVLYHDRREAVARAVDEVRRVLRPGGLFLATFASTRNPGYGRGACLAPQTYLREEAGRPVVHFFSRREDVVALARGFKIRRLTHRLGRVLPSGRPAHWVLRAERS